MKTIFLVASCSTLVASLGNAPGVSDVEQEIDNSMQISEVDDNKRSH